MKLYPKILMVSAACLLSACTVAHPESSPQLTFANYAPITMNAQSVEVVDTYKSKVKPDDISSQFVMAPADAVKRYAQNRFKSSGAPSGSFALEIEESFVTLRQIDQQNKVLEWSGVGKEDEYRVYLQVRVTAQPSGFNGRQSTTIKFDRTLVMPSSVTLAERDMRQTKFLEQLISDLDKRVNEAVDQTPAIRG
jgi:hypothetical protein